VIASWLALCLLAVTGCQDDWTSGHGRVFSHCKIEGIDYFTVGSAGEGCLRKPWEYRHILLVAVYSTERMKVFVVHPEKRRVEDEVLVDLGGGTQ